MTGPIRSTTGERIQDAFVESPTRLNQTAVEVFVGNANDISTGASLQLKTDYQESIGVVAGITTTVLTKTFSATKESKIYSISCSGENISVYELFINSVLIEKKRTYLGSDLNIKFDYSYGLKASLSALLELKIYHTRPSVADFNATLKFTEAL